MSKIIVTGGAGFIGSNLVDKLIDMDNEVLVIDNLSTGFMQNVNERADFVKIDIRDNKIFKIIKEYSPQYIFHLAAQIDVRKSLVNPIEDEDINIRGTINLLEAAADCGVKKIIFASSGGAIYGEARDAKEEMLPYPISPYGVCKLTVEHYLRVYEKWRNLNFTSLRYGNVYGPRQNPEGEAGVVAIFCYQLLKNEKPVLYGYGDMIRDYVFVDDVVNSNIKAMDSGNGGIYNIGTGKATTVKELFKILKNISKSEIEPELKEGRPGEIEEIWLNINKAEFELDWNPEISLEKGLKKTYLWFKERYKV